MPATRRVLSCLAPLALIAAMAIACAPPREQELRYTIRQDSTDPTSEALISFQLRLTSVTRLHDRIAWRLSDVWIIEPTPRGQSRVWHDPDPQADLWWVRHDDARKPCAGDFLSTPCWKGQAEPSGHAGAGLRYRFEAGRLDTPALDTAKPLTGVTYRVDTNQDEGGDEEPPREGEEEPGEVDDDPDGIDESEDPPIDS